MNFTTFKAGKNVFYFSKYFYMSAKNTVMNVSMALKVIEVIM